MSTVSGNYNSVYNQNILRNIFRPSYVFQDGEFQSSIKTTLPGNVEIGDNTTNYSLFLNGETVATTLNVSSWSTFPATSQINVANNEIVNVSRIIIGTGAPSTYNIDVPTGSINASAIYVKGVILDPYPNLSNWAANPAITTLNMNSNRISTLPVGTSNNASIYGGNVSNRGIYFPTNTQVAIAAGGSNIALFTDTSVGIGMIPQYKLDVCGDIRCSSIITGSSTLKIANSYNPLDFISFSTSGEILSITRNSNGTSLPVTLSSDNSTIGNVTLSSGSITAASSSTIGGVTLSGQSITAASSSTIGGVTLSGQSITAASNSTIGGVTLSGQSITAANSSTIGGVTLNGGSITAANSSTIGGVTLTNGTISGTLTNAIAIGGANPINTDDGTTNKIGGVTLTGKTISADGYYLYNQTSTGGRINVFPGTSRNAGGGPRGAFEMEGDDALNIGHYHSTSTTGDTLRLWCGDAAKVLISNDLVTFNTRITTNNNALDHNIGGVTLTNGTISGTFTGSVAVGGVNPINTDDGTTNKIGGVTLTGKTVSADGYYLYNAAGGLYSGGGRLNVFPIGSRNAGDGPKGVFEMDGINVLNIGHYDLSSSTGDTVKLWCGNAAKVLLSNDLVTFETRISNASTTSNNIGGVVLSNRNIQNILKITDDLGYIDIAAGNCNVRVNNIRLDSRDTNGQVGKIYTNLDGRIEITGNSNGNNVVAIDSTGRIYNNTNTSNNIGGVTLSSGRISNASTTSNNIGGVTLSGEIISNASTTSNNIGGVTLSSGRISNAFASSNTIGGIILSNGAMYISNNIGSFPLQRYLVLGEAFRFVSGDNYYLFNYNFYYTGDNVDNRVILPDTLRNSIRRMNLAPRTAIRLFNGIDSAGTHVFTNDTNHVKTILIETVCGGMKDNDREYNAYFI